jgi:predicted transcriptional regulator
MNAKERMRALVESQPENATYDEIMRELVFARMVERGLADSRSRRVITNEEMGKRIRKGFRED